MAPVFPLLPASTMAPQISLPDGDAVPAASGMNERWAEAARHAVLGRVLPGLRHDVAGAMHPLLMTLTVLERRIQKPEPDLAAIAKSVLSLSASVKKATADCIGALAWPDSNHDPRVSLRDGVDQAAKLLALEMSENALTVVNGVADGPAAATQSVMRSVFIGALLAFCDQHAVGGALEVTFQEAAADSPHAGRLQLRLLPGGVVKSPACPDGARKPPRLIGWPDVQAMAASCGVAMGQGDGWLTLDLPRFQSPGDLAT